MDVDLMQPGPQYGVDWLQVLGNPKLLAGVLKPLSVQDGRQSRQLCRRVRGAYDTESQRLKITDQHSQLHSAAFAGQAARSIIGLTVRGCRPRLVTLELNHGTLAARRLTAVAILQSVQLAAALTAIPTNSKLFAPSKLQLQALLLDAQVARAVASAFPTLKRLVLMDVRPPSSADPGPEERPLQGPDPAASCSAVQGLRVLLSADGAVQAGSSEPVGALPSLTELQLVGVRRTVPAAVVATLCLCSQLQRMRVNFAGEEPADAQALGGFTQLQDLYVSRVQDSGLPMTTSGSSHLLVSFPATAISGLVNLRELEASFSFVDVLALSGLTALSILCVGGLLPPPGDALPSQPCWPLPPNLRELVFTYQEQVPEVLAGLQLPTGPLTVAIKGGTVILTLRRGRHTTAGGVLLPAAERVLHLAAQFLTRSGALQTLTICGPTPILHPAARDHHPWLASVAALKIKNLALVNIQLSVPDIRTLAQTCTSLEVLVLNFPSEQGGEVEGLPFLSGLPRLRKLRLGSRNFYNVQEREDAQVAHLAAKRGALVAALFALYTVGGYGGVTSFLRRPMQVGGPDQAPHFVVQSMIEQLQAKLQRAGIDPARVQQQSEN